MINFIAGAFVGAVCFFVGFATCCLMVIQKDGEKHTTPTELLKEDEDND